MKSHARRNDGKDHRHSTMATGLSAGVNGVYGLIRCSYSLYSFYRQAAYLWRAQNIEAAEHREMA